MNTYTRLQHDLAAMLAADEKLQYVHVITEAKRDPSTPGALLFEEVVQNSLAGQVPVNGKAGLTVIVFTPEGKPESRANSGLCTDLEFVIRAIENPSVNEAPDIGAGIACDDLIVDVMMLVQGWCTLKGHSFRVEDFYKQDIKDRPDLWAWECVVKSEDRAKGRQRCGQVKFSGAPLVTLTCPTDDADIYYTLDGSLPTPANGTLYETPLDIEGPATLRATAWKTGLMPSNCAEETF